MQTNKKFFFNIILCNILLCISICSMELINDNHRKYINKIRRFNTMSKEFLVYYSQNINQEKNEYNNIEKINLSKLLLTNEIDSNLNTLTIYNSGEYNKEKEAVSRLILSVSSHTTNVYSIDSHYTLKNLSYIISSFIDKQNIVKYIKSKDMKKTTLHHNDLITLIKNLIKLCNDKEKFLTENNTIDKNIFNEYYEKHIIAPYNHIKKQVSITVSHFLLAIINKVSVILQDKRENTYANDHLLIERINQNHTYLLHNFFINLLSNEEDRNIVISYLRTLIHFFEYLSQENTVNIENSDTEEDKNEESLIDLLFFIYCAKENPHYIDIFFKNIEELPLFIEIQKVTDKKSTNKKLIDEVCAIIKNNEEWNYFKKALRDNCIQYAHEYPSENKQAIHFIIKNILAKDEEEEEFLQKICYFNPDNMQELNEIIELAQYINISDIEIILKKLCKEGCIGKNYLDKITSIIEKKVTILTLSAFITTCLKNTDIPEKNKIIMIKQLEKHFDQNQNQNTQINRQLEKACNNYISRCISEAIITAFKATSSQSSLKDTLLSIKNTYECSNTDIFNSILQYHSNFGIGDNEKAERIKLLTEKYLLLIMSDNELKVENDIYYNALIYDYIKDKLRDCNTHTNIPTICHIKNCIPKEVLFDKNSVFLYYVVNNSEYENISSDDNISTLNQKIQSIQEKIHNTDNEDDITLRDHIDIERMLYRKKYTLFKALLLKAIFENENNDIFLNTFYDINTIDFLKERNIILTRNILEVDNKDAVLKFFIEYGFKDYQYKLLFKILSNDNKELIPIIEDIFNTSVDWKKKLDGLISYSRSDDKIAENINNITSCIGIKRLTDYTEYIFKKITTEESSTIPQILFLFINHNFLSEINLEKLGLYSFNKPHDNIIDSEVYNLLKKELSLNQDISAIKFLYKYLFNKKNIDHYTTNLLLIILRKYPDFTTETLSYIINKECIRDHNKYIDNSLYDLLIKILELNPNNDAVISLYTHLLNKKNIDYYTTDLLSAIITKHPNLSTEALLRILKEDDIFDPDKYIGESSYNLLVKIVESNPRNDVIISLYNHLLNKKDIDDYNFIAELLLIIITKYPTLATKTLFRIINKKCIHDHNKYIDNSLYNLLVKILELNPDNDAVISLYTHLLNKKNIDDYATDLISAMITKYPNLATKALSPIINKSIH